MNFDRVVFAAKRRKAQDDLIAALEPVIGRALDDKQSGSETWWRQVVDAARPLFDKIVREDGGDPARASAAWAYLSLDLTHSLTKTRNVSEYTHTTIATWISSAILSAAVVAAAIQDPEKFELEWISMHDSKVRHSHADADGQKVKPGRPFRVGTSSLRFPGDSRAPIKEWINCRCTLAAVPLTASIAASVDTGPRLTTGAHEMTDLTAQVDGTGLIPWHGVLAPEGKWSGDKRMFAEGALTHRDLPLALTHQKSSDDGHKGSVTVASIDYIDKDRGDGLMWGGGYMLATPEADEAVGLLAHFGRYGVSVDADDAEFDLDEDEEGIVFSKARVCSASMLPIPAFPEAFVTLGTDPYYEQSAADEIAAAAAAFDEPVIEPVQMAISEKSWDGSASRFTPEEYKRSCILHKCDGLEKSCHSLPIKEPNGDLSRAGVHAAASRISQVDAPSDKIAAAKRALRSAYSTLGEDPPENLALDDTVTAGRGPGWVTNPEDTKRLHDYWTRPGEPGYAKVAWGTPGDFNRCRVEVGEEIGEDSPEKLRYINQICAQWHKDATGFWPGHAPTEQALEAPEGEPAPALTIVAAATTTAPAEWFRDPELTDVTPVTITPEGRVFGHLADWNTCHLNYATPGQCIKPPHSANGYAYFLTGEVLTDEGPVATGPLTVGGGHATHNKSIRAAIAHYDSTSTAVADVNVGEDEHGIWVAGWIRPWVSEEKVYELRAAALSGDWRVDPNTKNHEMIAALAVNSPGYPVTRVGISEGAQVSLVASTGTPIVFAEQTEKSPLDELGEAIAAALEDRAERRKIMAELSDVFEEV